ncbi:MAG: restriction endonuclease subunit S [Candidatus Aminicenantes bacterium]|nr:restriction endonuclease subunit S [Candidatus Aminicenantes bacterium]
MGRVENLRTENKFKKTEIGEIPVDWEVVKLAEVTQVIMGQSPPSESCFEFMNGVPFFQGNAEFGDKFPKILKWCNSPRKLAEKGDILVSVRAPVGDINIAPVECCIGRGLAALRVMKIHKDYLYFAMNYFKDALVKIGQGSTFEAINKKDLFDLKIPFPPLPEQKKIAEILTSVDDAIDKKREIIEKTKKLKKSLMQELLSHGIRHKKFKKTKIGEIPMDWEDLNLDNISEEIYRYPTYYNIEYVKEGIPEVRGKLIRPNGKLEKNLSKYRFISSKTALKFPRTCLREGDFIISVRGTLGKVTIVPKFIEGANITANLMRVSPNRKKIYPLFFHQILLSEKFQENLNNTSSSTTIKTIKAPELKRLRFAIPPLPEQKKIAEILTSVDEEIEKEIAQKERLDNIKKGLMQVLLTGKIRVKI